MAASATVPAAHTTGTPAAASFTFSPNSVQSSASSHGNGVAASSHSPASAGHSRSFMSFVRGELLLDESASAAPAGTSVDGPSQLVYNFLVLPWYLERLLTLGCLICADCFLHLFTVLPMRCVCAVFALLKHVLTCCCCALFRRGSGRSSSSSSAAPPAPRWLRALSAGQLCDLARGCLFAACWAGLAFINMSRMYHYIRGQSVLKLYVLFNMLQISDKLFCSFGEDILESLFGSIVALAAPSGGYAPVSSSAAAPRRGGAGGTSVPPLSPSAPSSKSVQFLHVLFHFVVSSLYVFAHAALLFAQVVTLNVSVNSDNSSLFVVLVSNNFIELKGAVFKRFDHHNLMQISAADIVERFQLTVFLAIILLQNLAHIGLAYARSGEWLTKAGWMCFMVLGGEWGVDWIKHGFITKFNGIPPVVYRHFGKVLCTDFIHTFKHKTESSIHSVSRRLGLPSLPIAVLVVRVVYQSFVHSPSPLMLKGSLLVIGFIVLALLKCLLTIVLLGHAAKRVMIEPMERERAEQVAQGIIAPLQHHARTTALQVQAQAHAQGNSAAAAAAAGKQSPSPVATSFPRSPRIHVHSSPSHVFVGPPPPHANPATALGSLLAAPSSLPLASSTASSPSMFGLREPRPGQTGSAAFGHLLSMSPLALEAASAAANSAASTSEGVSRSSTPRDGQAPTRRELFRLPSPTILPTSVPVSTSSSSSSRTRSTSNTPAPSSAAVLSSSEFFDTDSVASEAGDIVSLPPDVSPGGLSVSVADAAGNALVEQESLTKRFGHLIRTPTALERCNSNMSPQPPVTPPSANSNSARVHSVTVQLDGGHYASPAPRASSASAGEHGDGNLSVMSGDGSSTVLDSSLVGEQQLFIPQADTLQRYPSASSLSEGSITTSLSVQSGPSEQVEIHSNPGLGGGSYTTSAAHAHGGASASVVLSEGVAGLDVHIYHHQVPAPVGVAQQQHPATLVLTSPGAFEESGVTGVHATPGSTASGISSVGATPGHAVSSSAASSASAASAGAAPQPSFPPTVLTINSSSVSSAPKEKAAPQYDDAAKMEHDLLTVQRYKISAGKAIPV